MRAWHLNKCPGKCVQGTISASRQTHAHLRERLFSETRGKTLSLTICRQRPLSAPAFRGPPPDAKGHMPSLRRISGSAIFHSSVLGRTRETGTSRELLSRWVRAEKERGSSICLCICK